MTDWWQYGPMRSRKRENISRFVTRTFAKSFKHAVAWYVEGNFVILVGSQAPFQIAA
jgi:hypothetical protein